MFRVVLCLLLSLFALPVGAADAPKNQSVTLAIAPAPDSENPVAAGKLATLRVEGLTDWRLGRATVWPEADLLPVLVQQVPTGETLVWRTWGDSPALQFRAATVGRYKVLLLEAVDGADNLAEYVVEVGDPPPPPILIVEPPDPFRSGGPVGGPFSPGEQRYTVEASRDDWTADVGHVNWLSVLKGSNYVRVQVSPAADALEEGTYEAALTVRLAELVETRDVVLTVGGEPPPPPPPPPPKRLVGIVIEETSRRTAQQAQVLLSREVRALFGGGEFKVADQDDRVTPDLQPYVDRAKNKTLPVLFLVGDTGEIFYEGVLPATVDAMTALVKQYKPGEMK